MQEDKIKSKKQHSKSSMNKVLIIFIIFGILVLSGSVFYYLVIFLPSQANQAIIEKEQEEKIINEEKLQQKQIECKEKGEIAVNEDFKDKISNEAVIWNDPIFYYNPELSTCLYLVDYLDCTYSDYIYCADHKLIKDIYSNQEKWSCVVMLENTWDGTGVDIEGAREKAPRCIDEFSFKNDELMGGK